MEQVTTTMQCNLLRKMIVLCTAFNHNVCDIKTYIIGCIAALAISYGCPCMAAQAWSAEDGPLKVKFTATRISQVSESGLDYVKGKVAFNVQTKKEFFKKPILRVVMFTDENGARVIRDAIMDEPGLQVMSDSDGGSIYNMTTTIPSRRSNDVGKNVPDRYTRTIEEISKNESEVSKATYVNASYEGVPLGQIYRRSKKNPGYVPVFGFCEFNDGEKAKLLGYRLEVWHNGQCVASWESFSPTNRKAYNLPDDWHVTTILDDTASNKNESSEPMEVKAVSLGFVRTPLASQYVFKYVSKFKYRSPWAIKSVNKRDKSGRELFIPYFRRY